MGWVATPGVHLQNWAFGFSLATATRMRQLIDQGKCINDMPFGINLHMFQPGLKKLLISIKMNVRAVSFQNPSAKIF
ncbi:MAG: hypothetical protein CM15mP12_7450 [Gammaproteobacteria bacterium]|nr:MAG: hypothetical protein CM15mP12_7450 [Gammaproteobacteria bacterium]